MHGSSICCKACVLKVSSQLERCVFGVCGFAKGYDTIIRHGMWHRVRVYGVGGKLLQAAQSFHVNRRACVILGMNVTE